MLREFYNPFEQRLIHARETMPEHKHDELVGRDCPKCGGALIIKYGRFGRFIGCSNHPECTHTEPYVEFTGVACPVCGTTEGGQLVERRTKRGRTFYGCSRYPACEYSTWTLPKRADGEDEAEAMDVDPAAGQD
jgi:DNA topoisomerase-1